jgi:hypothetical protein
VAHQLGLFGTFEGRLDMKQRLSAMGLHRRDDLFRRALVAEQQAASLHIQDDWSVDRDRLIA